MEEGHVAQNSRYWAAGLMGEAYGEVWRADQEGRSVSAAGGDEYGPMPCPSGALDVIWSGTTQSERSQGEDAEDPAKQEALSLADIHG